MLSWVMILVLQAGAAQELAKTTAELRALAEEYERAEKFVEAGEAYVELARRPDARPREALLGAHMNFDSAFLASGDARQLCRALQIAERVVHEGGFDNDEQQKFWAELVGDDLTRLADDAGKKKQANCRFDAAGKRRRPVLLLAADDPPRGITETASPAAARMPGPTPRDAGRTRLRTAAGGTLLGLGIGFIGLTTGAVVAHGIQVAALERLRDEAVVRGGLTGPEQALAYDLRAGALDARTAAIGLGAAAAATFIPGVVLLARRHRIGRREVAFVPHGGLRDVGAALRMRF